MYQSTHEKRSTYGAGCLLAEVDRATHERGLVTTLGFVSQTGWAGLTLGGGFGYLTRRFGFTVNELIEVEIVTAYGQESSRNTTQATFSGSIATSLPSNRLRTVGA